MKLTDHKPLAELSGTGNSSAASVFMALGKAEWDAGVALRARKWLEKAVEIDSALTLAYALLADVCLHLGDLEEAGYCYRLLLERDERSVEALWGLGRLAQHQGHWPEAIEWFESALAIEPDKCEVLIELASACEHNYEFEKAVHAMRQALVLVPDHVQVLGDLGRLHMTDDIRQARHYLTRALQLTPSLWKLRLSLYLALADSGDSKAALAGFKRLFNSPERDAALWLNALEELKQGKFSTGWRNYPVRWRLKAIDSRPFSYPAWSGESMADETLLVYAEQGLGDEIMFASCLPDLRRAVQGSIVLECDPKLEAIFQRSFPDIRVIGVPRTFGTDQGLEDVGLIQRQVPIGDLPGLFRQSWSDFPRHHGYLKADSDKVSKWRLRLQELGPGMKLGISWRGGTAQSRSRLRTIPLQEWAPILNLQGYGFVSLQYGEHGDDLRELADRLGGKVHHWPEALADYDETAALVAALDGVVTVCTAVAHLTGALGQTGWVLVPSVPEWRYLSAGSSMPWYPSLTLIRQADGQPWREVVSTLGPRLTDGVPTGESCLISHGSD